MCYQRSALNFMAIGVINSLPALKSHLRRQKHHIATVQQGQELVGTNTHGHSTYTSTQPTVQRVDLPMVINQPARVVTIRLTRIATSTTSSESME